MAAILTDAEFRAKAAEIPIVFRWFLRNRATPRERSLIDAATRRLGGDYGDLLGDFTVRTLRRLKRKPIRGRFSTVVTRGTLFAAGNVVRDDSMYQRRRQLSGFCMMVSSGAVGQTADPRSNVQRGNPALYDALERLEPVYRDVIGKWCGLDGQEPRTVRQLAAERGEPYERTLAIWRRGLELLREEIGAA